MNVRARLPNRRASVVFDFEHRGLRFTCSFSCYPDGRVGELFVRNHKDSSSADVIVRDGAVIASLGLQHGCPLEVLTGAILRDPNGEAASPIGAALDLIVEQL
jgi:ribonucleoside-diphosphate reductase alpha chain